MNGYKGFLAQSERSFHLLLFPFAIMAMEVMKILQVIKAMKIGKAMKTAIGMKAIEAMKAKLMPGQKAFDNLRRYQHAKRLFPA